ACARERHAVRAAKMASSVLRTLLRTTLLAALAGSALACAGEQLEPLTRAEYTQAARRAFEEAEREFQAEDYEYARQLMDDVSKNYADTEYARRARLRLADISFALENFADAASEYKAFAHDHPNDPA